MYVPFIINFFSFFLWVFKFIHYFCVILNLNLNRMESKCQKLFSGEIWFWLKNLCNYWFIYSKIFIIFFSGKIWFLSKKTPILTIFLLFPGHQILRGTSYLAHLFPRWWQWWLKSINDQVCIFLLLLATAPFPNKQNKFLSKFLCF